MSWFIIFQDIQLELKIVKFSFSMTLLHGLRLAQKPESKPTNFNQNVLL